MKLKLFELNNDHIKSAFVGKIRFSDLDKIAKITYREIETNGSSNNFFQRPSDDNKIKRISDFIKKTLLNEDNSLKKNKDSIVLFPTAIIISLNEINIDTEKEIKWDKKEECLEFDTNLYKAFIIDGQHRFLGIRKFYEDTKISIDNVDIELPITVLVGYDIWEQSKIFAVVNFEQKPVSKSLYYDLFGSSESEYNEYTLSHSIVKHLNYEEISPFFGLIKMLGTGSGVISQAFLVEKINSLFENKKAFSTLYDDYRNKKAEPSVLYNIIMTYFSVIKIRFKNYYPSKKENGEYSIFNQPILFKTTGIGAFFRLINDFEKEIKMNSNNISYLKNYFIRIFSLITDEEAEKLFARNSIFSSGGGEGLQVSLYKEIKYIIDYKKDVVGRKYENAEIINTNMSKDEWGRNMHTLILNNGTTTKVNDAIIETIRNKSS